MPEQIVSAAPEMPELFDIEETNPLLDGGNVYDGIARITEYARFLHEHTVAACGDDTENGQCIAMWVVLDALRKQRNAMTEYHEDFVAWKEAQKGGAA